MKKLNTLFIGIFTLGSLLFLNSCEGFFGDKTTTEFLDEPQFNARAVAYVPIQPVWEGFSNPVDIIAGWDELIYVADGGTEEIISFDQSGNEQGRFRVPGLKNIAQDRRLDILASGTLDTMINGTNLTLPALYRLDLQKEGPYGIQYAKIKRVIVHPFYFKSSSPTNLDEQVTFEGIATLADNSYYVARSGPSNSTLQFGGPDDAVLVFTEDDVFETPVFVNTNIGIFRDYFKAPRSIVSFTQPPQSPAVNSRKDFVFASISDQSVLKVQGINFSESEFGSSYTVINYVPGDTSKADGFLYESNKFGSPVDVTISGDGTNYFFIVDAEKDSLYQFNGLGYEGVNPPPGSNSTKAILSSIGGRGTSLVQFNNPQGVAYVNEIVYVADAGNQRVLRFKLTTDFE